MFVTGDCNAGVRHVLISTVISRYGFHEVLQVIHLKKNQLMHNLSSVYFVKHFYMFRAYLQPIIRRYNRMDTTIGTYCSF